MTVQEFKRRCGNIKRMPKKDLAFVAICFGIAGVLGVLWACGII